MSFVTHTSVGIAHPLFVLFNCKRNHLNHKALWRVEINLNLIWRRLEVAAAV
jgi:hypothetical protein